MFEKLLLAATITFSMSLFIGTSQTSSLPPLAAQIESDRAIGLAKIAKLLPDRPFQKFFQPSTQLNQQLNQIEPESNLHP